MPFAQRTYVPTSALTEPLSPADATLAKSLGITDSTSLGGWSHSQGNDGLWLTITSTGGVYQYNCHINAVTGAKVTSKDLPAHQINPETLVFLDGKSGIGLGLTPFSLTPLHEATGTVVFSSPIFSKGGHTPR
jgi:hypothetical protein